MMPSYWIRTVFALAAGAAGAAAAAQESDYYIVDDIPVPDGIVAEVSGIDILPGHRIAVSTRRGDVFVIEGAFAENPTPENVTWTLFAEGLHELIGIAWTDDGWLYATQRPDVIRLRDTDGDWRADIAETVNDGWGISGDYHEYAFGSRPDRDGNIWVVLCLTGSFTPDADFRGWCVRVTPDGEMIPTTSGIRSPGGIGFNAAGDFFYCDNQGVWNGSSSLKHLKPGGFCGVPVANVFYDLTDELGPRPPDPQDKSRLQDQRKRIPQLVPPAAYLPHGKMGQSPAGIECDETGGKFGPFAGQLFIAEQTFCEVQRVFLEKVNGVYQGACFKFREGFGSGNIAVRFAPDGSLFTGGTDRGWGSRGSKRFALERVRWTGRSPFEVLSMHAEPDGFRFVFTEPLGPESAAAAAESIKPETYTYIYQAAYGSPEVDRTHPTITDATLSEDRRELTVKLDALVPGHVHEFDLSSLRSASQRSLLHPVAYYTLNEIPRGTR